MVKVTIKKSPFTHGFSKLSFAERIQLLKQLGILQNDEIGLLTQQSSLSHDLAGSFIENVIGVFPIPLGLAINFVIDDREYVIPMATEETSIIAAACKTAKWIRNEGEISTATLSRLAVGQIQLPRVKDVTQCMNLINLNKEHLIKDANEHIAHSMVKRGGGVKDITFRSIARSDGHHMLILHVMIDTCDAMGANMINQVCEFLKAPIEQLTNEKVGLCILSNLSDQKLTEAKIVIHNIDPDLGNSIEEASLFAQLDPYRAATNNKGILNAIDAILIATGNDWRAVEAGLHAYAAQNGSYASLSRWSMHGPDLVGTLTAPIMVGIVGGVTALHPIARICLKLLSVQTAAELARIVAAVGLTQNLGALHALVTKGIIRGHMKLHINNMALASGATQEEIPVLIHKLSRILAKNTSITSEDVKRVMQELRANKK